MLLKYCQYPWKLRISIIAALIAFSPSIARAEESPPPTSAYGGGIVMVVPKDPQVFYVGGQMAAPIILRNDGRNPVTCATGYDVYYIMIFSQGKLLYTSIPPNDQNTSGESQSLVTLNPGEQQKTMLNFYTFGLEQVAPGDYTVRVIRPCAFDGINRVPPDLRGDFVLEVRAAH